VEISHVPKDTGVSVNVIRQFETHLSDRIIYITISGRETWSLTLREEHRLRVFENSVEDIWT